MRHQRTLPLVLLGFALGACATAAVQSAPTAAAADASGAATVIALEAAERRTAPNGKATITHLARGENAYLGRLEMEGGGAVPTHRDPTEECIHVLEGGGLMRIDGVEHEISAGTTIYMPADAEVSYTNGPERLVAIQVFAGPAPAAKYEAWKP